MDKQGDRSLDTSRAAFALLDQKTANLDLHSCQAMRIEATMGHYSYLMAEQNGQVLGYAYASPHRAREAYQWSVDVTVYIAPHVHRGGIGRALYECLLAIIESQGFKHGHWHDVGYWCKRLNGSTPPEPVRPFHTLKIANTLS